MTAPTVDSDGTWSMPDQVGGPCRTWPLVSPCSCLPDDPVTWDAEQRLAVEVATEILWRLTAGRYGLCTELIRPCRTRCATTTATGPIPVLHGGRWFNIGCRCADTTSCGCGPVPELYLPGPVYRQPPTTEDPAGYPVTVWLDGIQHTSDADPAMFWLVDNRLVRTDGGWWPACQDMTAPLSATGTFGVGYTRGVPVPAGGQRAVTLLTCEVLKACQGDPNCRLPGRVQSITREGVSYDMLDPTDYASQGRTGLADVDQWLATVNPHGLRSPPGVWSPDLPTAWPGGGQ